MFGVYFDFFLLFENVTFSLSGENTFSFLPLCAESLDVTENRIDINDEQKKNNEKKPFFL